MTITRRDRAAAITVETKVVERTTRAATIARAAAHAALREPVSMTVTTRGELVTFESRLSDDAAQDLLEWCDSRFAASLYQQSRNRGLSPAQLAWAHKLATDLIGREQSADATDSGDAKFAALFAAFEAAKAKGAKRLTLRFAGINVKPSRDGAALWVTSQTETEEGRYGLQPKYLGKVTRTGMDSRLPDDVKSVLTEAAADPLTAAIRYGEVSGECSCCGRKLTDPQSIERGIGPVCATKFGW